MNDGKVLLAKLPIMYSIVKTYISTCFTSNDKNKYEKDKRHARRVACVKKAFHFSGLAIGNHFNQTCHACVQLLKSDLCWRVDLLGDLQVLDRVQVQECDVTLCRMSSGGGTLCGK